MDNNVKIDPWLKMGNIPGNQSSEISPEGLDREAKWNSAMVDAPKFSGGQFSEEALETQNKQTKTNTENPPKRDDNISNASAILNYGLNAAAREVGVETTIQAINNFVWNGTEDPIKQLLDELGIDTDAEIKNLDEESRAAKQEEEKFRSESINAPAYINKSHEGALNAIKEVKELISEIQASPAYSNLRAEAFSAGKGIFEYAISGYNVHDLTVLFNSLSEQKNPKKEINQIENQPSTENSSPDTDATANNKSLL